MPSLKFGGVRFQVFTDDHEPRHVHCFSAGMEAIVDLIPGGVALSKRGDATRGKVKKTDLKNILVLADQHLDELNELWEKTHGSVHNRRRD